MKFGIFSLPTYFPDVDGTVHDFYERLITLFTESEDLGFDSCWVNEHHYHAFGGMIPSPPVFLAAIARQTERVRLGTSVSLLPLHPPIELAEQYAMLDQISGGRLEFGFGRGFIKRDFEVLGVPWDAGQEQMLEALSVITKSWTEPTLTYHGKFYDYEGIAVWPRPLQQPHPPLWGAGTRAPESFRYYGRQGYNLMTTAYVSSIENVAKLVDEYWAGAEEAGHDLSTLECSIQFQVYCHPDSAQGRSVGQAAARRYTELLNEARAEGNTPLVPLDSFPWDTLAEKGRICAGSPDDCVRIIENAQKLLGLTQVHGTFYFGGIPYPEAEASLRLFAKEVIPRLRDSKAPRRNTVAR
ncbi:MAG: hypothetical protein QOH08_90 [Chloroflexota bacterium]|jgi:alkanesulfonate monooxygenase SsuD/methylene tetrahydromethanopterin reductase-like flavin-dependent oxidoreductase (luciferase family)|nr:hypothetical protein [Chloroflexota bacterium]